MNPDRTSSSGEKLFFSIPALFAAAKLLLHLAVNFTGGYGIFRDELYYVACANHPDIGYVDHPPLSIYLLTINRFFFGDGIFALRLLPAIAGAGLVYVTGRITKSLGGKAFAQSVACLASIVSLINLGFDSVFSMNPFDLLFGAIAAMILIEIIETGGGKGWVALGCVIGLGALNKIGMLWYGAGIGAGFLLTSYRAQLKTSRPWIAVAIAGVLFLPYVVWNFMHDFAHLEFIQNATQGKYSGLSLWSFTLGQLRIQNPVTLPIWCAGLCYFFFSKNGRRFMPLGIAFLFSYAILAFNGHSKSEYLASAFAPLFAGGGILFEEWTSTGKFRLFRPAIVFVLTLGLLLLPLVLPVLPVGSYISYAAALGVKPSSAESKELSELPQFYADMFGWEDKAAAVAEVFHALPASDQLKCVIFADNYGRCAAIDYYSGKYALPPAVGPHNSYWIWGPGNATGEVVIILGGNLQDKLQRFGSVEVAGKVSSKYCMPYENNLSIYVCRNMKRPPGEIWPVLKNFN